MTGVFPDDRTGHLLRAILGPGPAAEHWTAYAAALGARRANEGESRLFPLVAARLGAALQGGPAELPRAAELRSSLRWARIRQSLSLRARQQIAERLSQAGIPALWTKGTALGALVYRAEEPRVSMDVDVILRWPDVERVAALADRAGWVPKIALPSFDDRGALAGGELSYAIPGLVEVDFSWKPRMPFAFDPSLRDWLWHRRDPAVPAQPADPTWLLLETLEHGLVGNEVSPIRWVVDAVMLVRRCGPLIDWDSLAGFALRYRLVLPVLRGLETARSFGAEVPDAVLSRLAAHPVPALEQAEFEARVGIAEISRNYRVASSYNLLLRAGDGDLALLAPALAPVRDLGADLRARLERRLEQARTGTSTDSGAGSGAVSAALPPDAPLVDPGQDAATLVARARDLAGRRQVALALLHWRAAAAADPQDAAAARGLALAQAGVEDDEAACRTLAAASARFPDDAALQVALIRRRIACRQFAEALAACDALLARHPGTLAGLTLRATCLQVFCRDDEALADLREALRLAPRGHAVRIALARLLFETGRHDEVIETSRDQPPEEEKLLPLHLLAARAAARLGRGDEAEARFAQLRRAFSARPAIPLAAAGERNAALDPEGALARAREAVAAFPDDLAAHRMVANLLVQLERTEDLRDHLDTIPLALRLSTACQLLVFLPAFYRLGLVDECRKILVAQSRDGLPAEPGCEMVKALWTHGDLEESYARLSDLARRYPDDPGVQRHCVVIFGSRDAETLRRTKAGLRARLAPREWFRLVGPLNRMHLTAQERREVTERVLSSGGVQTAAERRVFLIGFRTETDPARIRLLLDRYRGRELYFEALKPALNARLAELERSDTGEITGETTGEATGETSAAGPSRRLPGLRRSAPAKAAPPAAPDPGVAEAHRHSRICLRIAQIAGDHPKAPDRLRDSLRRHAAAVTCGVRESWMDSGESAAAARALCDWLVARIAAGTPTSVIRLGDGEGHFLPYPDHIRAFQPHDRAHVQRDPWWGEELLDDEGQAALSAGLIEAIRGADVLGVPNSLRYATNLGWPTMMVGRDCRGIEAIPAHLEAAGHGGHLASCNLHTDLAQWDLYGRLLAGCGAVSVISCHDIAPQLRARFGLMTRASYRVPGEYRYRRSYHSRADGAATGRIHPDVFQDIMARLDPLPGEVHLVAAGILGKLFCHRIRQGGGIALDIGSQADHWADFRTRPYFAEG